MTLAPFPALCQVLGDCQLCQPAKLPLFHHARDLGNPISPPAGTQSPGLVTGKVLLCGHSPPTPAPAHTTLGSHSKPLLVKASCQDCLSVYMHPSVHLRQHFFKKKLECKAGCHSSVCPVHHMCTNMPHGEAGSSQVTKQWRLSTLSLSSPVSRSYAFASAVSPPWYPSEHLS